MQARVDSKRFGPWALITGASSGIGREFARQIAASHINVVLVARRQALLDALGTELARDFGVKHRVVVADLSDEGFMAGLAEATGDLDIGLLISNAGTGNPGRFIDKDREESRHDAAIERACPCRTRAIFRPQARQARDWRPSVRRSHGCRHGPAVHGA